MHLLVRGARMRASAAMVDRVLANPPFSQNYIKKDIQFPGRFPVWMPEKGKKADLMFVQHMLAVLTATGRMATVMPHGVLFRGGEEREARKHFIDSGYLEAVIGLGPTLFYGTGLAACILIFRQRRQKDRKNQVLIIDASKEFKTGRAQNELLPEHVERIHAWYRNFQDVEGIARLVTLDEIAANDHNLNIPRYVEPKVTNEVLTVEEAMQRLRESADSAFSAEEKLIGILKREGLLL
jgi:type I restriction enzyme M protein